MSALFGFVVGYVVGARAGAEGFERLERAVRDIRDSDEFHNFVQLLREHIHGTVQTVNDRLRDEDGSLAADVDDLVRRARARLSSGED